MSTTGSVATFEFCCVCGAQAGSNRSMLCSACMGGTMFRDHAMRLEARIAALREALARLTGASGSDHLAEGCACFHIAEGALRADDEAAK